VFEEIAWSLDIGVEEIQFWFWFDGEGKIEWSNWISIWIGFGTILAIGLKETREQRFRVRGNAFGILLI